ncbi:hypothetical protein J5J83_09485 [Azoarcus sp. L1K30]|uniref:SH3 domain-containing protein n=1 Tax=Azoarcus sp. L1K30 TaxID=2820277 RepID=UPI001B83C1EC|nr:SH3 domain-containing protein [Azoarcus sp. L1K30]MBR0566345.1 hypothetical protein [Azoarcus sp. L1K30]
MRTRYLKLWAALALAAVSTASFAIDFRSVSTPSIVYDTPSDKGRKLAIVLAGTPVEMVVTLDKWVKVRDPSGSLSWIDRRALADKRTVLVTVAQATVRQTANDNAPAVFTTVKDAVLEFVESAAAGWIKVRHADGASGYLRVNEVWGL